MYLCNACELQHRDSEMQSLKRCRRCGCARFHYAPSTRDIRNRCRHIQDGWTHAEELARRGMTLEDEKWYAPLMRNHPCGERVLRSRKGHGC